MKIRFLAKLLQLRYKFRDAYAQQVEADYARMQDPKYAERALEAEKALPAKPVFRKFGGKTPPTG